jgi:hypothetical protein
MVVKELERPWRLKPVGNRLRLAKGVGIAFTAGTRAPRARNVDAPVGAQMRTAMMFSSLR